ncbi:MAG: ATP-binding cassette domain-containing protein [Verrucomicrobiota bacterium]
MPLQLNSVTVRYGALTALRNVDFRIEEGAQVARLGPSGAGKSTLLATFNRRVEPASGKALVNDEDLAELDPKALRRVRCKIAWIPQDLGLVQNMSVFQNVVLGRVGQVGLLRVWKNWIFPTTEQKEEVHEILQEIGMPEKLFMRVDQLSGGQKQRVAIARALYQKPKYILADEPISSVDPKRAEALLVLLKERCAAEGLTLLVSTHDQSLACKHFSRIIGLREGSVVLDGPATIDSLAEFYSDL